MKHLIIFENFDLDKFLNNPEDYIHDETEEVGVGSYVETYRGRGQIIGETPEFWILDPMDSSNKNFKVPKDLVSKLSSEEVKDIKSKSSSSVNTQNELKSLSHSVEDFTENSVNDEDGEFKYRGNIQTALDFINDLVVDLVSLHGRDQNMKYYKEFDQLVSLIAILADNILESSPNQDELKLELDRILSTIGSL
jgi:hypothetical protein